MQTIVDESVNSFRAAVSELLKQGRLDEAEALCLAFIQAHPKKADGYFQQSLITLQKSDWPTTLNLLKKAIQLNPKEAIYHSNTGTALFMLKRYPEATSALEKALSLDPNHVNTLNNLGVVYSLQLKSTEAEALLKRSLEIEPNQPDTWLNLCSAVQDLDFREDDVVRYARKAVELQPRSSQPYTYLGKALLRKGEPKHALEAMTIAVLLDNQNADIHFRKGICHLELYQIPEAINSFQMALEIDPNHTETYATLADFLFKIEDFPAAEEAARKTVELLVDDDDLKRKMLPSLRLAEILFIKGDFDDAKHHYSEFKNIFNKIHNIITNNELKITPAISTIEWCKKTKQPIATILKEATWQTKKAPFFGSAPNNIEYLSAELPAAYIAEIADCTIIPAHELVIVDNEKTTLYNTLAHFKDWYGLQIPHLAPLVSNTHLLLDLGPIAENNIQSGILLMSSAGHNYAHWVTEQLPRLSLIEKFSKYKNTPIIINEGLYPQQIESLKLIIGDSHPIIILPMGNRHRVERLIYPSMLGTHNKNHPRSSEAGLASEFAFHPEAIHFLREKLLPQCKINNPTKKRLWVSRKSKSQYGQRRLINEKEIEALFTSKGFEIIQPETLSFIEQVAVFSQAEMIAGPGGAAMINMIFAPPEAKIILITKNDPEINFHYFANLAHITGQNLAFLTGEVSKLLGIPGYASDFSISLTDAENAIKQFLEL